jgi:hypothetical protein
MYIEHAKYEFLVRFYHWSLSEWDAEIQSGFARLKKVGVDAAERFLAVLQTRPVDVIRPTTVALIKRAQPDALPLVGESLTPQDRALLADIDTRRRLLPLKPRIRQGLPVARRRKAATEVRSHLGQLGKLHQLGGLEWMYETPLSSWTVQTFIDFGGSRGDLCYGHQLLAGGATVTYREFSFLGWLGISNTKWRIADEAGAEKAALQIVDLSDVFMRAVARLTQGLGVES